MKKVLIVEDEYSEVQPAFEYVNDIYLSNDLDLKNLTKSQDVDFSKLSDYDYIFLDITLAKKSQKDGYGILKKIEDENIQTGKLIIMTGNNKISETLKDRGIANAYPIITKPIDFQELKNVFEN